MVIGAQRAQSVACRLKDFTVRASNANFKQVNCDSACWVTASVLAEGPAEFRMPIYTYTYTLTQMHMHSSRHIHRHTRTYRHTYIQTHTDTQSHITQAHIRKDTHTYRHIYT